MADEAPLNNSPEARTETGEIKDQATPPTPDTATTSSPDPKKPETLAAEKPAEGEKKLEEKPAEGPPEKYEFKVPEGQKLNEKVAEQASAVFKELGLTQAQADKLTEIYGKQIAEVAEGPVKEFQKTGSSRRKARSMGRRTPMISVRPSPLKRTSPGDALSGRAMVEPGIGKR